MIQSIKKLAVFMSLVALFTSCEQGPTLQTYYVDNEQRAGFASFDAPTSLLNIEDVEMTEKQREAYESVDKLNVLMFKLDNTNEEEYKKELKNVKQILKKEKYQELMRGGNNTDGRFMVKFLGDIDKIDELILFGSANEKGFIIARVLGDNMNANDLMSLQSVLKDVNFEDAQFKQVSEFFK